MSIERAIAIAVPLDDDRRRLVDDLRSAASHAEDAEPGDRLDIIRYETMSSQLEAWVFKQVQNDASVVVELDGVPRGGPAFVCADDELPDWLPHASRWEARSILDGGGVVVAVALPLECGDAPVQASRVMAPPPATAWHSKRNARGTRAVEERFEEQLTRATSSAAPLEPISPFGIQNRILTDTLRRFVHRSGDARRVDVPVVWRDGSRASNPFPLHCLQFVAKPQSSSELELSFALLSIRHTELDAIVDGSWLRNTQISQQRTQAETDDLVYEISCDQLAALTGSGSRSVQLRMYQTGLEPAIVGFYRAVTDHLLAHPGTLAVIPMYYQEPRRQPRRSQGRNQPPPRHQARATGDEPYYSDGAAWATR